MLSISRPEAVGLVLNDLVELALGFAVLGFAIDEHFDIGANAGQRRSQLVADHRDELVLHLRNFFFVRDIVQNRDDAGGSIAVGDGRKRDLEGSSPAAGADFVLDDPAAAARMALPHLADQARSCADRAGPDPPASAGFGQIKLKSLGRGLVGEHQFVERIGHEHRVGNAVDDRLGVLPLGVGDLELDLQLLGPQVCIGDGADGGIRDFVYRTIKEGKPDSRAAVIEFAEKSGRWTCSISPAQPRGEWIRRRAAAPPPPRTKKPARNGAQRARSESADGRGDCQSRAASRGTTA